jgi:ribosomal protein S13
MKIKLSVTSIAKIRKSDKTFILYRLNQQQDKIIDFVLTDNLSRFRDQYNNKFKLVTDIKKSIKNSTIIL